MLYHIEKIRNTKCRANEMFHLYQLLDGQLGITSSNSIEIRFSRIFEGSKMFSLAEQIKRRCIVYHTSEHTNWAAKG